MIRKVLRKISNVLYKLHLKIESIYKEKIPLKVDPYILKYTPSNDKCKIIHINGSFIIGGSSQLIVDVIERTSDEYSHQLIVPIMPDPMPYQPVYINKFSIDEMPLLFKYLKNEQPELVHIHYWVRYIHRYESFAFWYYEVFKICEELKLKVIQNINVPTSPYSSLSVVHNVFVSNYVEGNFNNQFSIPSSVIYPGSDFHHFKKGSYNLIKSNCIGMVYRLDRDKLSKEAIEVFIYAARKKPEIICYIIGDGYYLEYYKKRVEAEQLEKNFIFTGVVSYKDLPYYYEKMNVFVAPVHDESFGQVTPFAMSMGLSVAGYDIGALSEILGYNDTLVNYGNVEGLANLVISLLNNPERNKSLGNINQDRALKSFSVENMIDQYKVLYKQFTA